MKIDDIGLRIIPDSKGKDTLEAQILADGIEESASVPSGESRGKNEAKPLEPKKALEKLNWIRSQLKGQDFAELHQFDGMLNVMDGTSDKSRLGANFILSLSLAFTKALARKNGMEVWELLSRISGQTPEMPLCFFNVIEGGVHTQNSLPFQEYWFIPRSTSSRESLDMAFVFLDALGKEIKTRYGDVPMGAEGGYTIPSKDAQEGLRIIKKVSQDLNLNADEGLDVAASSMDSTALYNLAFFKNLLEKYPLIAIEDPYKEDNFEGFARFTAELGNKIWVIGDDLTTTNPALIRKAEEVKAVNAVIIKPTQIGTVTQTLQAAGLAKKYGWKIVVANRGQETEDDFIADLSVGIGADAIKSGCPLQKERLIKYQRLTKIEEKFKGK